MGSRKPPEYFERKRIMQNEASRRWREKMAKADPEFHAKRVRKYREENPHLVFYTTSRYQAKKAGASSDLTKEDALDIYETPVICAYCGKERSPDDGPRSFCIDHVIPMTQGGPNSRWNLVRACNSCNSSKDRDSLRAFYERRPQFTEDRYKAIIAGMVELSGRSQSEIESIIAQSYAFNEAYERERAVMLELIG